MTRIVQPGGVTTDLAYDSFGRIVSVRGSLAYDLIMAGQRLNSDAGLRYEISYDALGRASLLREPSLTAGAARREHSYKYVPGNSMSWTSPEMLPGANQAVASPTLVNYGGDKIGLFSRNTAGNAIWRNLTDNTWSEWENLGGVILDYPGAASWEDGRIDMFGRGTDNSLYTRVYQNGSWGAWAGLGGGAITSALLLRLGHSSAMIWLPGVQIISCCTEPGHRLPAGLGITIWVVVYLRRQQFLHGVLIG